MFHNDVRVFLLRLLQGDPEAYRESAGRLASHFYKGEDPKARHAAAQRLFGITGKMTEQVALYTPHYVLEGHAVGVSLDQLTQQGLVAADALAQCDQNWTLAHQLATGLLTLEQLRKCLDWRSAQPVHDSSTARVTRLVERRVPPTIDWNRDVIGAALRDIVELHGIGETARAKAAFLRWFSGLSPLEIHTKLRDAREAENSENETHPLPAQLGRASVLTKCLLPSSDESDAESGRIECEYARGLLDEMSRTASHKHFVAALYRVRRCYVADVQGLLTHLVGTRAWSRCSFVLFSPIKRLRLER